MPTSSVASRHTPGRIPLTLAFAVLVGLVPGCAQAPRAAALLPEPVLPTAATTTQEPEPVESTLADGAVLTVDQVVRQAAIRNPTQTVFAATRAAALAEVEQSQAWANPGLELSGGESKAHDGSRKASIYGVDVRQRVEMSGKRRSRIHAAKAGQVVTEREVAIDAIMLEGSVRTACMELASAETTLLQTQAALAIAEQVYQAVIRRTAATEAEPGELARAKLEQITTTASRDRAARQVIANRAAVRAWAGGGLPEHFTITDALPTELPVVERQTVLALATDHNPRLALLRAQVDVRIAELEREKRSWQPDVTVGAFFDREADSDNVGLSLGMDLPLWDRNHGGIAFADAQHRKALAQLRAEQQLITRDIDLAWQMYESSRLALGAMIIEATTAAEAALSAKLHAFAIGEASLFDVLDARRASQAVDAAALDARRAAAEAWLDLGRATGSFLLTPNIRAGDKP